MTTQHNKQTAAEFFARFSADDIPGAVDLLSADATWWIAGTPELFPPAGRYTKEEIAKLFARMTRRLKDGLSMTVKNAIAEGDLVALEVESHGELTNGRVYHNEYHTLMRVFAGRIHEVREYSDTQHAYSIWLEPEPRPSSLSPRKRARRSAAAIEPERGRVPAAEGRAACVLARTVRACRAGHRS
jgi:ketosteroid isomerase-like protein